MGRKGGVYREEGWSVWGGRVECMGRKGGVYVEEGWSVWGKGGVYGERVECMGRKVEVYEERVECMGRKGGLYGEEGWSVWGKGGGYGKRVEYMEYCWNNYKFVLLLASFVRKQLLHSVFWRRISFCLMPTHFCGKLVFALFFFLVSFVSMINNIGI